MSLKPAVRRERVRSDREELAAAKRELRDAEAATKEEREIKERLLAENKSLSQSLNNWMTTRNALGSGLLLERNELLSRIQRIDLRLKSLGMFVEEGELKDRWKRPQQ